MGIWIRVSAEEKAQGETAEYHKRRATLYAESKGWTVVRVYDLPGAAVKTLVDHREAKAMMRDVASGQIAGLIFSRLAHLVRNSRELRTLSEYFQQFGADLISVEEPIDTSTSAGRVFHSLVAAFARWESEEIVGRVKLSAHARAKMGRSLGGAAPFGYRKAHHQLVLDEKEAPIRRLIFDLFLQHRRLKTVARLLNESGHRTRAGKKFSDSTVRRLLEDPLAKGQRRSNYTTSKRNGKRWELKAPEEWIFSDAPGVVSVEEWEAVNALLAKTKGRATIQT